MSTSALKEILDGSDLLAKKALFQFSPKEDTRKILLKFNLWSRYFFPQYFQSRDGFFHEQIDTANIQAYKGELDTFTDIAFKGAAKTSRTKLFTAFFVCNDREHFRRYVRVLAHDGDNSKQITLDVYNMLVNPRVAEMYPETFAKTEAKREEKMEAFTTATGVKVLADTVGSSQRGALQEEARPDFLWFEDFETRATLRSARVTQAIWDNMEEARTGLAVGGVCIYTCNYVSEMGNVHKLVGKEAPRRKVLITSILKEDGSSAWPERISLADIEDMRENDEDFEGERLCSPSASKDVMFDRETLDAMKPKEPVRTVSDFRMFYEYDPSHRYGSGHDVAGGVQLDSSTSVFIDFETVPARVVATFKSDTIKPEPFGDEVKREGEYYGLPICGIEKNNHGHTTIARARHLGVTLFKTPQKETKVQQGGQATEYGWRTDTLSKPRMVNALVKAVNDGHLYLADKHLIDECKSYTRNDQMDDEKDPRLTTRHFDLLIARAIAWQMKAHTVESKEKEDDFVQPESETLYPDIGI
jgi:hypothetical protein